MYNYALYTTNNNNIKAVELIAINPNTYTFKFPIEEEYFLYSIFIGGSQSGVDVVSYEENGLEPHYFQLSVLNDTDITFDTEIDQNYFYPAGQNLFFKTRYNLSAEQCAINLLNRDLSKLLKLVSSQSLPVPINNIPTVVNYFAQTNSFKYLPYIKIAKAGTAYQLSIYLQGNIIFLQNLNLGTSTFHFLGLKITCLSNDVSLLDDSNLSDTFIFPTHCLISSPFTFSRPTTNELPTRSSHWKKY